MLTVPQIIRIIHAYAGIIIQLNGPHNYDRAEKHDLWKDVTIYPFSADGKDIYHCGAACQVYNANSWTGDLYITISTWLAYGSVQVTSSRLGSSFSRCAPAATYPKLHAKHYAARAAACRGYHIGTLQVSTTVPLMVAFYDPR
jgi:hypothetical protein